MKYKVIEIFDSIDGEGIRTGLPVSFIRLAGCNLRCSYCDTLYSLFGEEEPCEFTEMTESQILSKLNPLYKRVTLTGGEPLIAPYIDSLINELLGYGYEVNVETNGACDIKKLLGKIKNPQNLFFTIDYKLPSSDMEDRMLIDNFFNLKENDVIKFVVGSDEDALTMLTLIKRLKAHYEKMPHIFIGAVYGAFGLESLAKLIIKEPVLSDARLQVQLHKIVWEPDKRGV